MRFFLISIFCIALTSCASYSKKNNFNVISSTEAVIKNDYFSNPSKDYIYRAKINIYKNSFSGIFIVKKISENEHRVVFTTEMGSKIFDFSYIEDEFKVNFILEEMNKKILINILKQDFKVLIANKLTVIKAYEHTNSKILQTRLRKESILIFDKDKVWKFFNYDGFDKQSYDTYFGKGFSECVKKKVNNSDYLPYW